jgi:hypothetical protein
MYNNTIDDGKLNGTAVVTSSNSEAVLIPDVVQEVPRFVGRDVLWDEELSHDSLQVPEGSGLVRDQSGEGFFRICRKKTRNRAQGCLAVEEVAGEVPFGY